MIRTVDTEFHLCEALFNTPILQHSIQKAVEVAITNQIRLITL